MNLLVTCCNFRNTPIEIREKFSLDSNRLKAALDWFSANSNVEVIILATCNRVEIYIAGIDSLEVLGKEIVTKFLSEFLLFPLKLLKNISSFLGQSMRLNIFSGSREVWIV
jgi:glutamyl-tRNA reductase